MTCPQKESVWPFLCILACLFVLSVAAPRAWDRANQNRTAAELAQAASAELEAEMAAAAADTGKSSAAPLPPIAAPPTVVKAAPLAPPAGPVAVEPAPKIASEVLSTHKVTDPGVEDLWDENEEELEAEWAEVEPPVLETVEGLRSSPTSAPATKPAIEVAILAPVAKRLALDPPPPAQVTPAPVPASPISPPALPHGALQQELRQVQRLPSATPSENAASRPPASRPDWKCPESLRQRLEKLSGEKTTASWAAQTRALLDRLGPASAQGVAALQQTLADLERHVSQAETLADRLSAPRVATELRRSGHAVGRRIALWKQAVQAGGPELTASVATPSNPQQLTLAMANLDILRDGSAEGRAWQQFLLLEKLSQAAAQREADQRELHRLAQLALSRLALPMTAEQHEVLASAPVTALAGELRRWAAEPIDLAQLLEAVEQFEQAGLPSQARRIAEDCRRLSFSPQPAEREMAERLEMLYRNANLRITLSQALLNRLVPTREPEYEAVRDTILGLPVRGRSVHSSDLRVRFIPDPQRLLMSFEVQGNVSAVTSSNAGPAVFFNDSHAQYIARKPLEIESQGIQMGETEVSVSNHTRLRGLRTKFDAIPLVGSFAREVARSQLAQRQPAANEEAEWKMMTQCRERIDAESYARLNEAVGKMKERLFAPLEDLSLTPALIGAQTTEQRMTMRLRLATDAQLGSDTPRPRAPSDSLASLQVHETAINNLLSQLQLDGRRITLPELVQHLSDKLHRPAAWSVDPGHADVVVTFAAHDAIRVRCVDNQLAISLTVAELAAGERRWSNFQVRVHFRPDVQGRAANLIRDGVVQLAGRLSTGSQIAVRGVFSKIFPKDSTIPLTPTWLLDDSRLGDLAVTQFVVDDGWIGVALGSDRAKAERKERLGWRKNATPTR